MNEINYDGYKAVLKGKILTISKIGERRHYTIKEKNNGIEYEQGSEYFYIRTEKGFYYQFKMEVNDGFIGDKYSDDDEFLDSFACFTFGE